MLSINIFTEKIYVILWFWFVVLSVVTFFDLIFFVIKNMFASQRYFYVKKHVVIFSSLEPASPRVGGGKDKTNKPRPSQLRALNEFSNKFLKPDIVLVLKIIAANVNGLVVSELVKYLWEAFLRTKNDDIDNDVGYDDFGPQNDDEYLEEKEMNDEMDADRTASFPLNRQPVGGDSSSAEPSRMPTAESNKNNGPVKRLLGFRTSPKDASSDDKRPSVLPPSSDAVTTIKANNMPTTSSGTTSIV